MEHCELCDKEFEHDTTTAYYYKVTGDCLCFECLEKKETQQEIKDDCRGIDEQETQSTRRNEQKREGSE